MSYNNTSGVNGLSLDVDNIKLGGNPLIENTIIDITTHIDNDKIFGIINHRVVNK